MHRRRVLCCEAQSRFCRTPGLGRRGAHSGTALSLLSLCSEASQKEKEDKEEAEEAEEAQEEEKEREEESEREVEEEASPKSEAGPLLSLCLQNKPVSSLNWPPCKVTDA